MVESRSGFLTKGWRFPRLTVSNWQCESSMQAISTLASESWCPLTRRITDFCGQAVSRGDRLPVRHSLAATLYADAIWDEWMRLEEEHASGPIALPSDVL